MYVVAADKTNDINGELEEIAKPIVEIEIQAKDVATTT